MKTKMAALAPFTLSSVCGAGDSLTIDPMATLDCSGQSAKRGASSELIMTKALVRVSGQMFYVKISGVAYGTSAEAPRPHDNTKVSGSIRLTQSGSSGRGGLANYTLDIYSGDLLVGPSEGGKVFFVGVCKKSEPLF